MAESSAPSTVAPIVRALINAAPGGFTLNPQVLRQLWERAPHFFDEPMPAADFKLPVDGTLEDHYPNLLALGDEVRFLRLYMPELRTDAWLVERFNETGTKGIAGKYCHILKTVEVPVDAKWHVVEFEDGTEALHEHHRVWS